MSGFQKMPHQKAEERYQSDSVFRALVDILEMEIEGGNYTPTELREAVILAATKYEMRTLRHLVYGPDMRIIQERFQSKEEAEGLR